MNVLPPPQATRNREQHAQKYGRVQAMVQLHGSIPKWHFPGENRLDGYKW